jgi:hypothetical protein
MILFCDREGVIMIDTSPVFKKLLVRPDARVLILNLPPGTRAVLEPLPPGAVVDGALPADCAQAGGFDVVVCFVASRAELERCAPAALSALRPRGLLWFAYPKKSGAIRTDMSRDEGWAVLTGAGWQGVAQIAVDATWSALRFRPVSEVGT